MIQVNVKKCKKKIIIFPEIKKQVLVRHLSIFELID